MAVYPERCFDWWLVHRAVSRPIVFLWRYYGEPVFTSTVTPSVEVFAHMAPFKIHQHEGFAYLVSRDVPKNH